MSSSQRCCFLNVSCTHKRYCLASSLSAFLGAGPITFVWFLINIVKQFRPLCEFYSQCFINEQSVPFYTSPEKFATFDMAPCVFLRRCVGGGLYSLCHCWLFSFEISQSQSLHETMPAVTVLWEVALLICFQSLFVVLFPSTRTCTSLNGKISGRA